jgi:hypothetical protein
VSLRLTAITTSLSLVGALAIFAAEAAGQIGAPLEVASLPPAGMTADQDTGTAFKSTKAHGAAKDTSRTDRAAGTMQPAREAARPANESAKK